MAVKTPIVLTKAEEGTLEEAKGGNSEAYEQIFLSYREKVFNAAYHLCNFDREAALDLTQDVFLKVWEKLYQFDSRSDLYTWIYRIMINIYLKERRKKRLYEKFLQIFQFLIEDRNNRNEEPCSSIEQQELRRAIVKAMEKLSSKQEIVFKLKIFDGMTFSKISEVTGMAEGTVKTHFTRAIHTLQRELREWLP
ncbi:MAG: sigma-70 family RNA polymerase sigma factor [Syntrophobacterales bacterium]|nr:sigma-70 family RNA polymerase sigma factor [Syntrophobacterales bacterium]